MVLLHALLVSSGFGLFRGDCLDNLLLPGWLLLFLCCAAGCLVSFVSAGCPSNYLDDRCRLAGCCCFLLQAA
jgi:hypothetical protein